MANPFSMTFDISSALAPLRMVVPYDVPTDLKEQQHLRDQWMAPLVLRSYAKKEHAFDVMGDLVDIALVPAAPDQRPLVTVNFHEKGWDRLAYLFLSTNGQDVKKDPKSVPRSMRAFANLMNKLTEEPTGHAAVDVPRKVVINRAIEQLAPGVREEIQRRIISWTPNHS